MKIQADVYLAACGHTPMPKKYELRGWRSEPTTEKQKLALEGHGIAYARVKYKGQASMILDLVAERSKKDMATPKQIQILLQHGYAIGRIHILTKRGASRIISGYNNKPTERGTKRYIRGYIIVN